MLLPIYHEPATERVNQEHDCKGSVDDESEVSRCFFVARQK